MACHVEGTNCNIVMLAADAGCVQSDTFTIDTLRIVRAVYEHLRDGLKRLIVVTFIHRNDLFDIVVSDIAPGPLAFVKILSIPSILITNFTGIDIHEGFPELHLFARVIG